MLLGHSALMKVDDINGSWLTKEDVLEIKEDFRNFTKRFIFKIKGIVVSEKGPPESLSSGKFVKAIENLKPEIFKSWKIHQEKHQWL